MKLHSPFFISSRLLPALKVGDAVLQLELIKHGDGSRHRAVMVLDLEDGTEYRDDQLQSGAAGFRGAVEVFETFLSFLGACGESMKYQSPHFKPGPDHNGSLFPLPIAHWAAENCDEISMAQVELQEEDGNGRVRSELIEE